MVQRHSTEFYDPGRASQVDTGSDSRSKQLHIFTLNVNFKFRNLKIFIHATKLPKISSLFPNSQTWAILPMSHLLI